MYRSVDQRREFGVRDGPFTGGHVIDVDRLGTRERGELDAPMAMHSEWRWPLLYAAIGAIAAGSLIRLAFGLHFAGWQPLPQGTFLFPLDLLVVTGRRIHVTPFGDVRVATIDEKARSVEFTYADGRSVTVSGE